MNYDYSAQLLIIGDSSVGKTSILTRYSNGTFKEDYIATVGLDYYSKNEFLNGKTIHVKIWDTAGQERYKALTQGFFRNAQGVMIVYDVTNSESFENLKYWISSIQKNIESNKISIPVILLGNKIDVGDDREIKNEDAEKFAEENKYKYFETSAKTGEGIDDAVRELVNQVLSNLDKGNNIIGSRKERESVMLNNNDNKGGEKEEKKKGCC